MIPTPPLTVTLTPSNRALLTGCATQDPEAWAELYRRFRPVIQGRLVRILGAASIQTEDLSQDVFLKVIEHCGRLAEEAMERPDAGLFGWIATTASHAAIDQLRRRRDPRELPPDLAQPGDWNTPALNRLESKRLLEQIDEHLMSQAHAQAARDRTIFWLHYRDGVPARRIAERTPFGLTPKGVEAVIRRQVAYLKGRLVRAKHTTQPVEAI
ncbi:MAG: sigma-70 family RNA polymerase sigma factor [Acidobacteria bacterium]|nr:sigma-70 family RNA polymerase sigma factor [Acidobacteriota bacterium]